jgi:hypothetical protein
LGWEKDNLLIGKFSGFFVVIALAFGKALAVLSWMTLIGIAGAHLAPSDWVALVNLSYFYFEMASLVLQCAQKYTTQTSKVGCVF